MSNRILPILSGSLEETLKTIAAKTNDPICLELIKVNDYVETYNLNCYMYSDNFGQEIIDKIIDPLITDEVRMISVRMGDFDVSFLPKGKEPEYGMNHNWARKNRQTGKPARIFQKLLKKEFKTREWEIFTNLFKAELCQCAEFKIVQGEDIRYWYNEDHYYRIDGTLGNSCMRYDNVSDFFDVYVDKAKMLITTKEGLLTGRALVWEVDGVTLLDRIYTCFDYLENCFIDYAKEQGWWIREENCLLNTGCDQGWYKPDDDYDEVTYQEFKIKLDKSYEYMPYVDSFRYYDESSNTICTNHHCEMLSLDSTDGNYRGCTYECYNCGQIFHGYEDDLPYGLHYSEWGGEYYCDDCCWYSNGLDDYIPNNEDCVTVLSRYDERLNYPETYVDDHFVNEPDGSERYPDIVRVNNTYYHTTNTNLVFNLKSHQYEIRSDSN